MLTNVSSDSKSPIPTGLSTVFQTHLQSCPIVVLSDIRRFHLSCAVALSSWDTLKWKVT